MLNQKIKEKVIIILNYRQQDPRPVQDDVIGIIQTGDELKMIYIHPSYWFVLHKKQSIFKIPLPNSVRLYIRFIIRWKFPQSNFHIDLHPTFRNTKIKSHLVRKFIQPALLLAQQSTPNTVHKDQACICKISLSGFLLPYTDPKFSM